MGAIFLTTKNFVKVIKLNCELKDEKKSELLQVSIQCIMSPSSPF